MEPSRLQELASSTCPVGNSLCKADQSVLKRIIRTGIMSGTDAYASLMAGPVTSKKSSVCVKSLIIARYLFPRSAGFRHAVVDDIRSFVRVSMNSKGGSRARQLVCLLTSEWAASHGHLYPSLNHAARMVANSGEMRVDARRAAVAVKREIDDAEADKAFKATRFRIASGAFADAKAEIHDALASLNSVFDILVPNVAGGAGGSSSEIDMHTSELSGTEGTGIGPTTSDTSYFNADLEADVEDCDEWEEVTVPSATGSGSMRSMLPGSSRGGCGVKAHVKRRENHAASEPKVGGHGISAESVSVDNVNAVGKFDNDAEEDDSGDISFEDFLRLTGLGRRIDGGVSLDMNVVAEECVGENEALFEAMRDGYAFLTRKALPNLRAWCIAASNAGGDGAAELRVMRALRHRVNEALGKCKTLGLFARKQGRRGVKRAAHTALI